jgi:serine protease AprX
MNKNLLMILWLFVFLSLPLRGTGLMNSRNWVSKVDPFIFEKTSSDQIEFIVFLKVQADLSLSPSIKSKPDRGRYVVGELSRIAEQTQEPILEQLKAQGVSYRAFWIANMIWVKGNLSLLQMLAGRRDVGYIYANPWVKQELPKPADIPTTQAAKGVEWNVSKIRAPDLWVKGYKGQGIVIGGQDTGYEWRHPALKGQYRGWDGETVDHNYNWHDAIHSGSSSCAPDIKEPCDDQGHGTHTMGTIVGDDNAGNQVGIAPEAQWIGCRNMIAGVGSPSTYAECYQWFIAPTDLNDLNPRPDLAPDIINNSWSCTENEGCTEPDVLRQVVENVRAAGILTVHSAGNKGAGCSTVSEPAAIYDASFTVGATDSNDKITSFSSRGPVTVDGSSLLKPDISAPGSNIRSATRGGVYSTLSGTSMAAPHVAGAAALVLSAYSELRGNVGSIETLLERTAVPRETDEPCGGTDTRIPNNTYGWGRVDALSAYLNYEHHLKVHKTSPDEVVSHNEIVSYTLTVTHTHYMSATTNLVLTDKLPEGTHFSSSDTAHLLEDNILTWEKASLDPGQSWSVRFDVTVDDNGMDSIANADYQVWSDHVIDPATGPAVTVWLRRYRIFMPEIRP